MPEPQPPRPLVFLDIDGVLATARTRFKLGELDPICVQALNALTEDTGAELVISSTWRMYFSVGEMRQMFTRQGVTARIVGYTAVVDRGTGTHGLVAAVERGREIALFLQVGPPRPFVILDDDDDMAELRRYLVRTTSAIGLTPGDVLQAKAILAAGCAAGGR